MKNDEFEIRCDVERIVESGGSIVFPVRAYSMSGEFLFEKPVPIRAEFFAELRKTGRWKNALKKILHARIGDEMINRKKSQAMPIEDKLEFMDLNSKNL